jgi:hypothetical protein
MQAGKPCTVLATGWRKAFPSNNVSALVLINFGKENRAMTNNNKGFEDWRQIRKTTMTKCRYISWKPA